MPSRPRLPWFSRRWFVPAVLAVSVALRVALALRGGQYFFGDEGRYGRGIQLYVALASGDFAGVRAIVALPEHALFPWVGAFVTAVQHLLAQLTPYGDWTHPEHIAFTQNLGAAVLSLFSAASLFLLHRLAKILGADEPEAGWALLLMAASNTAFYYSRHLLPYDVAIAALLASFCVGLRRPTVAAALGCGLLAGATYHLYNGYWFAVPIVWLLHTLAHRGAPRSARRALVCAGGVILALGTPLALGYAAGGASYFAMMSAFSRSVTQGLFSEGWSLPWAYFWHSEGLLGIAVVALIALALARQAPPARVHATLLALALAYALIVLFSVGLGRFVVYARTVKPFVPAFCLLGGWSLARLLAAQPRLQPAVVAGIVLAGALHFWPHFTRMFPREIELAVLRNFGVPKRALTVTGSLYIPLAQPVTRPDLALVNCQMLYPVRGELAGPAGRTIFAVAHPLSYAPFQYESHTPRERAFLRRHDISIRLIELAAPASLPNNPPPAVLYQTADRPTGR